MLCGSCKNRCFRGMWQLHHHGDKNSVSSNCELMLCCVALVRTDVSEECSSSIIRVTRISELRTALAITANRCTLQRNTMSCSSQILVALMMKALHSSETSDLIRATWHNIPVDGTLLLKSGLLKCYEMYHMS
jgi:hypothetical protein